MNNFIDLCSYFNNENNNSSRFDELAAFKNYYNAYSSYLVSRKYNLEDIKRFRMNSVIDYFIQINMLNDTARDELRKYYLEHIHDNFNRSLDPPKCPFYLAEKAAEEQRKYDEYDNETDEVKQHYRELDARCKYFAELNYKLTHPEDDDNKSDTSEEYHDYTSTSSEACDFYEEYSYDDYDNNDAYDNDNYEDEDYDDDYY